MSTPSPTPALTNEDRQYKIRRNALVLIESRAKDLTPPPSPPQMQDSITVLMTERPVYENTWGWWQGYRMDRALLGFEPPVGKEAVLMPKRRHRRRRRDDD